MGNLAAPRWYTAGLVTAVALYLLHLAGQWRDLSDDDPDAPVPIAEFVHTHATGVFLPLALYAFFEERAGLVERADAHGARGLEPRRSPRCCACACRVLSWQFLALAATIGAVAISEWFEGPVVAIGWALEGAALGYAALQSRSRWLDRGALVLFVMSALRLVDALATPMAVGTWPVVNTRALAALVVVGAMAWLAARAKDAPDHLGGPIARHALIVGGQRPGDRLDLGRDRPRVRPSARTPRARPACRPARRAPNSASRWPCRWHGRCTPSGSSRPASGATTHRPGTWPSRCSA